MPTLALINQKGGVGKTTVTLGLASIAQSRGSKCCVVDLDPQANATTGLGVWDPEMTVDRLLVDDRVGSADKAMTPSLWPAELGPAPMVLASRGELAAIEPQLMVDPVGGQDRLARVLQGAGPPIRFIDCPPSLGLLSINALFAADRVAVVTEPSAWATDAVAQILSTVERINQRRSVPLEMAGIVVNRLGRTRDARYWHEHLVEAYPSLCLPPIHLRAAVAEASAQSLPLVSLGTRPGTAEAVAEFSSVYDKLVPVPAPGSTGVRYEL